MPRLKRWKSALSVALLAPLVVALLQVVLAAAGEGRLVPVPSEASIQPSGAPAGATVDRLVPKVDAVYVLAEDEDHIPMSVGYDRAIAPELVKGLFLSRSRPEPRALIVTKESLARVVPPPTGPVDPGGSPEYYAILQVLWDSHIPVLLDGNSDQLADHLGLSGVSMPFDPYGRPMPPDDVRATAACLAFTFPGGWTTFVIANHQHPSRDPGGQVGSGNGAYGRVNSAVERLQAMLRPRAGRWDGIRGPAPAASSLLVPQEESIA